MSKNRLTCHVFPNSLEGVVAKLTAQIELFSGSITQSALYRRISALGIDTLRMNKEVNQLRRTLAIARKKLSADELGHISRPSDYGFVQRFWLGHHRQNIPIFDRYHEKATRLNKDLGISQSTFTAIALLAAVSQSRWESLKDAQHHATIELGEFFELHVARVRRRYQESLKTLD